MAFGQHAGPPATARQMQRLTELIHEAGHTDFRDARGPLGLNQREAAGNFTRDAADAMIERLETEQHEADSTGDASTSEPEAAPTPEADAPTPDPPPAAASRTDARHRRTLQGVPDHILAGELQQRGWVVMEP